MADIMWNIKYQPSYIVIVLLLGLLSYGCQYHLQAYEEEDIDNTAGTLNQSSEDAAGRSAVVVIKSSRKRPAEEWPQNAGDKQDRHAGLEKSSADTNMATMLAETMTASITQESQETAVKVVSPGQAAAALAKAEQQDMTTAQVSAKATHKKDDGVVAHEVFLDLRRWFKEFTTAVDDEAVLYSGNTSEAIPMLIQEGKNKGYLTKTMKLPINEVGWEPDCTPLHYAAAKGNTQAVSALLKEPAVIVDAKTEDNETTPLQFATFGGHLGVTKLLVEAYKQKKKMAEIDAHDKDGMSALQHAALGPKGNMNKEVAVFLIAQGADPTQLFKNKSPLICLSAAAGNLYMVEYWIEKIACTGLFSDDEEREFIERSIKLAKHHKHTGIVIMLQDYCKRRYS